MVATQPCVVDGHKYEIGDTIPDLGSLVCVNDDDDGQTREYEGLSADASKLPHYDDLMTGSSAFFYDTGDVYKYEKTTDAWIKL